MSAIPYSTAKHVSDKLGWPKKFYWAAFEILTSSNGLQFALNGIQFDRNTQFDRSLNSETAYFVLKHIIYRTLQFEKAFEFIRSKDVIRGMPGNAIPGCGLSDISVKRVLNRLSPPHSDLLVKLYLIRDGKRVMTPLYGLNLPGLLKIIDMHWENEIMEDEISKDDYLDRPNKKPSNLMLRGRCMLRSCVEFSFEWEHAFEYLASYSEIISDTEEFVEEWRKHFPNSTKKQNALVFFEDNLRECGKVRQLRKDYLEELKEC